MSAEVLTLTGRPLEIQAQAAPSTEGMLASLDALRKHIEAGRVVAFAAAAIDANDQSYGFTGSINGVSRLRLAGSIAYLEQAFLSGSFA